MLFCIYILCYDKIGCCFSLSDDTMEEQKYTRACWYASIKQFYFLVFLIFVLFLLMVMTMLWLSVLVHPMDISCHHWLIDVLYWYILLLNFLHVWSSAAMLFPGLKVDVTMPTFSTWMIITFWCSTKFWIFSQAWWL